jgi:hypothetical protein
MDFEQREVRLRTGTCPSCSREFAFVEGATVASRLSSPPPGPSRPSEAEGPVGEKAEGGPECGECGSLLTFREGERGSLEAICADCATTTVFVPQGEAPRPVRGRERPERPPRSYEGAPRGRPCRKCGAPLTFSTDDDGNLVGECAACGNRFTLPPRSDRGGGGWAPRGGPRYGRREFRPGARGRPPYRSAGGDRGSRPFRSSDRRGPPRLDDEDRRRRRRRREE